MRSDYEILENLEVVSEICLVGVMGQIMGEPNLDLVLKIRPFKAIETCSGLFSSMILLAFYTFYVPFIHVF